jgi:hypothetical protein
MNNMGAIETVSCGLCGAALEYGYAELHAGIFESIGADAPSGLLFVRDDSHETAILQSGERRVASRCVGSHAVTISDQSWMKTLACSSVPSISGLVRFWQEGATRAVWFGRRSSLHLTFVDANETRSIVMKQHESRRARICKFCNDVVVATDASGAAG